MQKHKPEILAPAGDRACLAAALNAGADAVYFGTQNFNMRASAPNFNLRDLPDVVQQCHTANAKAYLTLNTIIFESELAEVREVLQIVRHAGVDAIIASDLAVLVEAAKLKIPIHVSTQLSISNTVALQFFNQEFGIQRVVLARECSLDEIKTMALAENLPDMEIEVFVHGAMCVAVSGRCFMSQFQYGKSANRGECLQPCRREYRIHNAEEEQEFVLGDGYVMSPRDLCTLGFIEQLIEAGIAAFKIEGRNRSPEYVSVVTSAYRQAVDYFCEYGNTPEFSELKKRLIAEMERVYNRGFSSGFYLGRPLNDWTSGSGTAATIRKDYVGLVTNYYSKIGVAEVLLHSGKIKLGDQLLFIGFTTGAFEQQLESMQIEHQNIEMAEKGQLVAIKTEKLVRRDDKLYLLSKRVK